MATTEDWATMETFADDPIATGTRCLLDLRRRVEALEQRAPAPAPEPGPAPAADRPLWEVMQKAWRSAEAVEFIFRHRYAAEIDAVAEWLDARGCMDAGDLLRAEARRAREGQ